MAEKKTTYKASHVLIREVPDELQQLYHVAHEMATSLATLFLAMLQKAYTRRKADGAEVEVDEQEIERELREVGGELTDEKRQLFLDFANGALWVENGPGCDDLSYCGGQRKPENCYNVLYLEQTAAGSRPYKRKEYRTLKQAVEDKWSWKELKAELEGNEKAYRLLSLDEWRAFHRSRDLQAFGKELLRRTPRKALRAALRLRELGVFPLPRRGLDAKMLQALTYVTTARLRSWRNWNQKCMQRKESLGDRFRRKLDELDEHEYALFRQYAEELEERQYGLTKKVVFGITDAIRKGAPGEYKPAYELLGDIQYQRLKRNFRALGFAYLDEQRYLRAPDRARVTLFDAKHSPLLLPFGMTGRGYPFRLSASRNALGLVVVAGKREIGLRCVPSRYFWRPRVEPVKDGFSVEFTRLGGGNPRIKGIVKEPALMKVEDRYYVNMRVNVDVTPVPDEVKAAKSYFRTNLMENPARPKRPVRVMGVDLGLNPAVAYAVADLGKEGRIPCPVHDMAPAAFECSGSIGRVVSRRLHHALRDLSEECHHGARYIRLSKKLRDRKEINEVERAVLGRFVSGFSIVHVDDASERKDRIGRRIGEIVSRFRHLSREFSQRDNPGRLAKRWEMAPAETFQMLRLLQKIRSLLRAWARYHWTKEKVGKPPENELRSYNERYRNLRLDTLKKLVHQIVAKAKQLDIDIVVVEDLGETDYDDEIKGRKENTLRALWSPNMVLDALERELSGEGIDSFRVDPCHTSQISSLTDEFGFRDKRAKEKFYFRDQGAICRMNADVNAAMNMVRRFLTRYRSFTGLRAWELTDGSYLVPESKSKRQNAFLKLETRSTFAKLVPKGDWFDLVGIASSAYDEAAKQVRPAAKKFKFYRHEGGWLDLTRHQAERDNLARQARSLGDKRIKRIEL